MDQPDWRKLLEGVEELGHGAIKVVQADSPDFDRESWKELTVLDVTIEGDNIFIEVE